MAHRNSRHIRAAPEFEIMLDRCCELWGNGKPLNRPEATKIISQIFDFEAVVVTHTKRGDLEINMKIKPPLGL